MKKLIALMLIAIMIFPAVGCSSKSDIDLQVELAAGVVERVLQREAS